MKRYLNKEKFYSVLLFFFPYIVFIIFGWYFLDLPPYKFKLFIFEGLIFSSIFYSFWCVLYRLPVQRYLFLLFYLLIAIKAFILTSYYYLYGTTISPSTIFILLESNFSEAKEFLEAYFTFFHFSLLLILILPVFLFGRKNLQPPLHKEGAKRAFLFSSTFFILLILFYVKGLSNFNFYFKVWDSYEAYKHQSSLYDRLGLDKGIGNFQDVKLNETEEKQIFVVVIGESTTRHRMGLYGYSRQTNPQLAKIRGELKVFQDVISPHTHTIASLTKILGLNQKIYSETKQGSILQLMNQAGFKTYWISNQKPVGWNENLVTKISKAADEIHYINDKENYLETPYDEQLLVPLQEALGNDDKKVFIVLHLLGTHVDYKKRYPKSFEIFKGEAPLTRSLKSENHKVINEYDNAIRYNDHVLSKVIKEVKKMGSSSYVLYFSDHGEDVYQINESASHTETNGTKPMYDVPFVLWTSEEFMDKKYSICELERKYMLDDLIHSISDLSGVRFKGYAPEKSIFNSSFKQEKRIIYNQLEYDSIFNK